VLRVPGPPLWMVPIVLSAWGVVQILRPPEAHSLDVPPPPASVAAPVVESAEPIVPGMARSVPTKILIKSVWINANIDQVGLAKDGTLETPSYERANNAAWYRFGPSPGETGPAVIVGHVDSKTERAVFFELRRVKPGATIEVSRADGTKALFKVDSVEQFPKSAFPTERVYGPTHKPTLRLVTCGGRYNRATEDYPDNIIVFATLAPQ
jgi:hypothetical protein